MQAGSVALSTNPREICSPSCCLVTTLATSIASGVYLGVKAIPNGVTISRISSACCQHLNTNTTQSCLSLISKLNITDMTAFCSELQAEMQSTSQVTVGVSIVFGAALLITVGLGGLWLYRKCQERSGYLAI